MNQDQIRPMSRHVGSEVHGLRLASASDSDIAGIKHLLAERGLVVFRDQDLSEEDHIAFARRIGPIVVNNYFPANGGHPEIAEVRKSETQQVNIGGGWHTDHSYDQVPAMGSILVARELPPSGGDTLFASMAAAYDSLSDAFKATLETLRAVHTADHIYGPDGFLSNSDQGADLKGRDLKTRAVHPLVIRHPDTGQKLLYVNSGFTTHIEGWTRDESLSLLNYLFSVGMREEFQCRLQWAPGTVAMWDNRSTWHYALNDYHGHRRLMHRITIDGVPIH
ncbi:TauD/TfdA family dioxygenase [Altererythrobacter sp. H2]|uniref:TauD/TfdA dioxygenase family protein n=1 Tax=Altererythrobacter sp. H2 TaxID=3108391 RepID=UPI002B4BDC67|nr:TauD/TfdA family dioxygenase [Altererythrobacter sp. H2]WRK95196.1 TauD/TfdA family dioxygenase [Altererythrobacter sp. H2]